MRNTALIFIVLSGFIFCGKKSDTARQATNLKAAITYYNGDVSRESEGKLSPAKAGDILQPNDVIITGPNSSAELMVQSMGVLKVGSDSRIRIQTLFASDNGSSAEVKLERGDLSSMVKKQSPNDQYSVITPTAIAGVRGTTFVTRVQRLPAGSQALPQVSLSVLEGAVNVKLPGQDEVVVTQNSELVIRGFQKLSKDMIRPLSREALEAMKNMAVFHKTNVMEFNSLMADLQSSSAEMRMLESDQSVESTMDARAQKQAALSDDSVQKAKRVNETKFIKRDTEGDPVKLKPSSSFKE